MRPREHVLQALAGSAVIIGNDTRLMIGDFIGLPALRHGSEWGQVVVDLIEDGIEDKKLK